MFKINKKELPVIKDNTTQLELEQNFSSDALDNFIELEADLRLNDFSELIDAMEEVFPDQDTGSLMSQIIALFVDPSLGENNLDDGMYSHEVESVEFTSKIQEVYNMENSQLKAKLSQKSLRIMKLEDLSKVLVTLSWFRNITNYDERVKSVLKVLSLIDGYLGYVFPAISRFRNPRHGEGAYSEEFIYKNVWYMVVDFQIDPDTTLISSVGVESLPMIEQPKDWKTDESGGYYSLDKKVTKRLGEATQSQESLDTLNTLQRQPFVLADHVDKLEYSKYIKAKQEAGDAKGAESELVVSNTTSTFDYVTGMFLNPDNSPKYLMFFEWNFDFRGRMYSTGFNINLQSDSYKKAMILPHESNFDREEYSIDTTNLKELFNV